MTMPRRVTQPEVRSLPLAAAKLTTRDDGDGRGFTGYASMFNEPTMIGEAPWGFRETVAPTAFTRSVSSGDAVMLYNHNTDLVLARQSAGTLNLTPDAIGLRTEAPNLPNTSYANDLIENIRVGNVKGMSFGFQVLKDSWTVGEDGVDERTLEEVRLLEVSAVVFPAYEGTMAAVRSVATLARRNRAVTSTRDIDDDDPNECIKACEASLDAAVDLYKTLDAASLPPEVQQMYDYVAAAQIAIDSAMDLLGLPDPDEAYDGATAGARGRVPAPATPVRTKAKGNPATATSPTAEHERLRLRAHALAALIGLDRETGQ